MKIKYDYKRSPETQSYIDMMVASMPRRQKKSGTTVQSESTQKILARDPSLDEIHSKRSIDLAAAHADRYYERPISAQEFNLIEGIRRKAKNTLGNSEKSSVPQEKRERAIEAFTYSQPIELSESEKQKITQLETVKELKELPIKNKKGLLEKFLAIFNRPIENTDTHSYAEMQAYMKELEEENK